MRALRRSLGLALVLAFFGAPLSRGAEGVLPSTNLAPQHLLHLSPRPDAPGGLPGGATSLALDAGYASVFSAQRSGGDEALLDMEVGRLGLRWARGLGRGVELEAEVPWLWLGAGSFDTLVTGYHDALGLPNGNRDRVGRDDFGYLISRGRRRYAPRGGAGLGDGVVGLKWTPSSPGRLRVATRGLVKLPTGDPDRGLGSGSLDASAGALGAIEAGTLHFAGSADAIYVGGTPDSALSLGTHWAAAASATAGARVTDASEALVQLSYSSSPYETGLRDVDGEVLMLSVGMRGAVSRRLAWAAGFTEDLLVRTSPDFGVFLSLETIFDASFQSPPTGRPRSE